MESRTSRSGIPRSQDRSANGRRHLQSQVRLGEEEPVFEVRSTRRSHRLRARGVYREPHARGLSEGRDNRERPIREPHQPPIVELQKDAYGQRSSIQKPNPISIRSHDIVPPSKFPPKDTINMDFIRGPAGRYATPRAGVENHDFMDLTLSDCRGNNQGENQFWLHSF